MSDPQREADAVLAVGETRASSASEPALARTMLLPLGFVAVFSVRYGLGTSLTVALAAAAPFVALFAMAPILAGASQRRFERVLATALATGNTALLQGAWQRARLFRWFGLPAVTAEKRGLVASVRGDLEEAQKAYGAARKAHGDRAPLGVDLGYADACYALGDDAEAIVAFRRVLTGDPTLHRVRRHLAHALLRHGPEGEASEVLATCPEPEGEVEAHHFRLLKAAAFAASGDKSEAKRWRKKAGKPRDDEARALSALDRR